MRISNVQNLAVNAANAMNKCCKPRKANENNAAQNSLKSSPMQDMVSFGRFDKTYKRQVTGYTAVRLVDNWNAYNTLKDSIYLNLQPTKETRKNPQNDVYELELVSYKEFRPWESQNVIDEYDSTMHYHINTFNEIYGYESDWEKHLTTTEDFEKAARLASYLDDNGYFPNRSGYEYDNGDIHDISDLIIHGYSL